jgi:hypothetical protein
MTGASTRQPCWPITMAATWTLLDASAGTHRWAPLAERRAVPVRVCVRACVRALLQSDNKQGILSA